MKITRLLAWIGKVTSWDFCTLLPFIQSGDDIFSVFESLQKSRLGHFFIFILFIYMYHFVTQRLIFKSDQGCLYQIDCETSLR